MFSYKSSLITKINIEVDIRVCALRSGNLKLLVTFFSNSYNVQHSYAQRYVT